MVNYGSHLSARLLSGVVLGISLEEVVVEFIEVLRESTVHIVPPVTGEIFLQRRFSNVFI